MNRPHLHKLLFAIITQWQTAEAIRRNDYTFDAFNHIAEAIGHKNPSTLRKMCLPPGQRNGAKLGFQDAIIICSVTGDLRLKIWFDQELHSRMPSYVDNQLGLFATPVYRERDNA